jgi:hypothetical protein
MRFSANVRTVAGTSPAVFELALKTSHLRLHAETLDLGIVLQHKGADRELGALALCRLNFWMCGESSICRAPPCRRGDREDGRPDSGAAPGGGHTRTASARRTTRSPHQIERGENTPGEAAIRTSRGIFSRRPVQMVSWRRHRRRHKGARMDFVLALRICRPWMSISPRPHSSGSASAAACTDGSAPLPAVLPSWENVAPGGTAATASRSRVAAHTQASATLRHVFIAALYRCPVSVILSPSILRGIPPPGRLLFHSGFGPAWPQLVARFGRGGWHEH